jgi:hypothetical protein
MRFAARYQSCLIAFTLHGQEGKYSRDAIDDVSDSQSRLRLILDKTPALIYSARPTVLSIS